MIKALLVAAAMTLCLMPATSLAAEPTPNVTAEGNKSWINTQLDAQEKQQSGSNPPAPQRGASYPLVTTSVAPWCEADALILCDGQTCPGGQEQYVVVTTRIESEGAAPQVTEDVRCGFPAEEVEVDIDALAIEEFYATQVTVPAPTVHPGNGLTLVNFPNVYSTEFAGYEKDTDISAADVRLKLTPVKYVWNFGDEETFTSTVPGEPFDIARTDDLWEMEETYPITHRYTDTGDFSSTVTVVISGEFSVNGGDWQPIAGSIQATSAGSPLNVAEARGELIKPGN